MLIDDTRKMCEFREIQTGQVFRFHNYIYMKTDRWVEHEEKLSCNPAFEPNAVQVDTGFQASFFDHEIVELLPKAKLVV